MRTCLICRFETDQDDVALQSAAGYVICARCYFRETAQTRRMSRALRRDLVATLAGMPDAPAWMDT